MANEVIATAGAVRIVIVGDGANFSSTVADVKRAVEKLEGSTKQAGHSMVTSVQAASGTIRLLEGDITRNVRAVEKFITMIPGVGTALKVAFPVVGALALGGVLARLGQQVEAFLKNLREGPQKLRDGFETMKLSATTANDELRKSNDELTNQIAKLEGKPQNNLAIALDDARIMSDNLQRSLQSSYDEVKKLLEETRAGFWEQLLGKGSTADVQGNIENFYRLMKEAEVKANDALHRGDTSGAKLYGDQLRQLQQNAIGYANSELATRSGNLLTGTPGRGTPVPVPYARIFGDQTKNIEALTGMRDLIYREIDRAGLQVQHSSLEKQRDTLQHDRDLVAERMTKWRQDLEAQKAQNAMSLEDEQHYWQARADSVRKGSALYTSALMEANKASVAMQRQLMSAFISGSIRESRDATRGAVSPLSNELNDQYSESMQRDLEAQRRAQEAAVEAFKEMTQQLKANEAIEEERIKLATSTGGLSRLDAAHALQAIHEGMFAQWGNNAAAFSSQFPFAGVPGAADMLRQYGMQSQQDRAAVEAATALGQLRDSVNATVQKFTDVGAQLSKLANQTLNTVNDAIIKSMVDPHARGTWSQAGKSIFSGVAKSGLELAEGSLMKALFGKNPNAKLGTKDNPMYTRSADAGASAGNSAGILGGIFGGSGSGSGGSSDSSSSGGGLLGGILSSIFGGISGHASGGYTPAGPILVGERGPEIWNFASAGHVTPNHRLGGVGDTHHHWNMNVDARGAHDPVATAAQINRALEKAKPAFTSFAISSLRELNSRLTRQDRI